MEPAQATLLYDGRCTMCQQLALWVEKRSGGTVRIDPWQRFRTEPPNGLDLEQEELESIKLYVGGKLLGGTDAWVELLRRYKDLRGLQWVARQLGLERTSAGLVKGAAHGLRFFCTTCRGRR